MTAGPWSSREEFEAWWADRVQLAVRDGFQGVGARREGRRSISEGEQAMSDDQQLPPGPWAINAGPALRRHKDASPPAYLEVRGPNGEAICTIFPGAGNGGIGIERARAVARLIVEARDAAMKEIGNG
jgi:hypothetical protein